SPDSTRVVYRAAQDTPTVFELYSRPIDGSGTSAKINDPLVTGGDVQTAFLISPDRARVVYLANPDTNGVLALHRRPIAGSGSAVKLNGALATNGDVQAGFVISPDSARVAYRADQDADSVFELYSRAIDGSGSPTKLNGTLVSGGDVNSFAISSDS